MSDQPIEEAKDTITEMVKEETDTLPYTVRTRYTGDRVFLIKNGKKQWVRNPETLEKLGFTLGQEKNIEYEELSKFEDGGSIDLASPITVETLPEKDVEEKKADEDVNAILGVKNEA